MAKEPDTHYLDKLTSVDNLLNRLVQLEEGRIPPINYSNELTEIRKILDKHNVIYGEVINSTSGTILQPSNNPVNFETDQPLGTVPTHYIEIEPRDKDGNLVAREFKLEHIRYLMNPTNAVTYELYLFESNIGATYEQKARCVFDSRALRADNEMYIDVGANTLPMNVKLRDKGKLWYMLDWSGAPGATAGYIVVMGEEIK